MGPDIVPFSPPRINGDRWLSSLHDEKFIEVEQTKLVKIFHFKSEVLNLIYFDFVSFMDICGRQAF
jgi:hypothetical protein